MPNRLTRDEAIAKFQERFPDMNIGFDRFEYNGHHGEVTLTCLEKYEDGTIHGDFTISFHSLFYKKICGCKECRRLRKRDEIIAKSMEVHKGQCLSYEKSIYDGWNNPITVTCNKIGRDGKIHGDFPIRPDILLNSKYACPKCMLEARTKTREQFIEEARRVHGDKYDYSRVIYKNDATPVEIICPIHGSFWQSPSNHLHGKGCKKCNESNLERRTRLFLDKNMVVYRQWEHFSWLGQKEVDFYLPEFNVAIECQGIQHYEPVLHWGGEEGLQKQIERDHRKKQLCEENNLSLYYIRYDEDVEEVLKRIFIEVGIVFKD